MHSHHPLHQRINLSLMFLTTVHAKNPNKMIDISYLDNVDMMMSLRWANFIAMIDQPTSKGSTIWCCKYLCRFSLGTPPPWSVLAVESVGPTVTLKEKEGRWVIWWSWKRLMLTATAKRCLMGNLVFIPQYHFPPTYNQVINL